MSCLAFHLAFPVKDLESIRTFYRDTLGCQVGRETKEWIDFSFFGHQITAHLCPAENPLYNQVDGHGIPIPHFGCVLEWDFYQELREKLEAMEVPFQVKPYIRFEGCVGEQGTMFIQDPSGNFLEFKTFRDSKSLFAREFPEKDSAKLQSEMG